MPTGRVAGGARPEQRQQAAHGTTRYEEIRGAADARPRARNEGARRRDGGTERDTA